MLAGCLSYTGTRLKPCVASSSLSSGVMHAYGQTEEETINIKYTKNKGC
jgi:hypothetical protein